MARTDHHSDIAQTIPFYSESRVHQNLSNTTENSWIIHPTGITLSITAPQATLLGYSVQDLTQRSIYDLCPDEERSILRSYLHTTLEGKRQDFQLSFRAKHGAYEPIYVRTQPMRRENGQMEGIIITISRTPFDLSTTTMKHIQETNHQCPECQQLNKQKDDFITMASHELKTPLTSIKAFTQILKIKQSEPTHTSYLHKIENQTNRMMKLINDLLDVSKIRAGKFILVKEWFDFDSLVAELVEQMMRQYGTHTISIIGSTERRFYGDPDRIRQALQNLIHNAIKYSPHKQGIEVRLYARDNRIGFEVKDEGIGIAQSNQQKLFQPFFRVMNPEEKEFPGLGTGLYICAEIMRAHQGTISVVSYEGKGSSFIGILPIHQEL